MASVSLSFSFSKPGLELDSQFRLFLSSKPDKNFPLELLQLGLKVSIRITILFPEIVLIHCLDDHRMAARSEE